MKPISSPSPLRDDELAVGEAEPQRRVSLREHGGAPDDVEQLGAREPQVVLERLGEQLAEVRELPVDPARRQPDAVGL